MTVHQYESNVKVITARKNTEMQLDAESASVLAPMQMVYGARVLRARVLRTRVLRTRVCGARVCGTRVYGANHKVYGTIGCRRPGITDDLMTRQRSCHANYTSPHSTSNIRHVQMSVT